jgi:hypothetical protein
MRNINNFAIVATAAAIVMTALPASAMQIPSTRPGGNDTPHQQSYGSATCGENLVSMKRVKPAQIANVTDKMDVWVTEVCYGQDLGIANNEGNVAAIRTALAANDVIIEKLWDRAFTEGDVISVKMIDTDTIQLFVAH